MTTWTECDVCEARTATPYDVTIAIGVDPMFTGEGGQRARCCEGCARLLRRRDPTLWQTLVKLLLKQSAPTGRPL